MILLQNTSDSICCQIMQGYVAYRNADRFMKSDIMSFIICSRLQLKPYIQNKILSVCLNQATERFSRIR